MGGGLAWRCVGLLEDRSHPYGLGGLLHDGAWRPLFCRTEAASRSEPILSQKADAPSALSMGHSRPGVVLLKSHCGLLGLNGHPDTNRQRTLVRLLLTLSTVDHPMPVVPSGDLRVMGSRHMVRPPNATAFINTRTIQESHRGCTGDVRVWVTFWLTAPGASGAGAGRGGRTARRRCHRETRGHAARGGGPPKWWPVGSCPER